VRPTRSGDCEYAVPFSRPRSLETTFAPDFVALVHELRGNIDAALA